MTDLELILILIMGYNNTVNQNICFSFVNIIYPGCANMCL